MAKRKVDVTAIRLAIEQHTAGLESSSMLAQKLGVDKWTFNNWLRAYERYGIKYFHTKETNSGYTKELKLNAVKEYLSGIASRDEICLKYEISSHSVLQKWINLYNEGKEIKDYNPKQGFCQMKSRKVSKSEKLEIVEFCINSCYNYKLAAEKFSVPYSQVYQWVQKHKEKGCAGLDDRRGRRKHSPPLSEVEQLKKELEMTQRKLEYAQIENEILKKKEEIELKQIFQRPNKK